MNFRHLRYFVAASEHGSFRKAGAALGVQESTISRRIRDMEDGLGSALFHRHSGGVCLTVAGQRLLSKAQKVLRYINEGAEIVDAVRSIARKVKKGEMSPDAIDDRTIAENLYAPDVPDPDLMIRTSGELRISNFLLWQLSYSEFYVTDVLWPDFREAEFEKALEAYSRRHRRFGDIK